MPSQNNRNPDGLPIRVFPMFFKLQFVVQTRFLS